MRVKVLVGGGVGVGGRIVGFFEDSIFFLFFIYRFEYILRFSRGFVVFEEVYGYY